MSFVRENRGGRLMTPDSSGLIRRREQLTRIVPSPALVVLIATVVSLLNVRPACAQSLTGEWEGYWFYTRCRPGVNCVLGQDVSNIALILVQNGSTVTGSMFSTVNSTL